MKFQAPTDEPIHVALTSGHTAIVTQEGTDLDEPFYREAVKRGALPVDANAGQALQAQALDRKYAIRDALVAMQRGGDKEDFTKDGKPDLRKLNARVGFPVPREEADLQWSEIAAG